MADRDNLQEGKQSAVDFLRLVVAGQIDEAYQKYVDMQGVHHNPFFPAGFSQLMKAMIENHTQFPHKQIMVKHVLADEDLVAVHSNLVLKAGEPGMTVVHIFRFNAGRIVEMWDIGQTVPADSPNQSGAF